MLRGRIFGGGKKKWNLKGGFTFFEGERVLGEKKNLDKFGVENKLQPSEGKGIHATHSVCSKKKKKKRFKNCDKTSGRWLKNQSATRQSSPKKYCYFEISVVHNPCLYFTPRISSSNPWPHPWNHSRCSPSSSTSPRTQHPCSPHTCRQLKVWVCL